MKLKKNLFDFENNEFYSVEIEIMKGKIHSIKPFKNYDKRLGFILPGLIDSHIHIESSMLVPSRFSEFAVKHGVVSVVADPHEITNVLGVDGFNFMYEDSKLSPLKIYFAVPSCVPATKYETSGAVLSSEKIDKLLSLPNVVALGEMMNFPGVINDDQDVHDKINCAKKKNIVIDGHAPGLVGDDLLKYISSGISTDHESSTYNEAIEKIEKGMMIQIREGSAAKNFDELWKLIDEYPDKVMLCTDDSHPDDLEFMYIDSLIKRGLKRGLKIKNLYKAAFFNPINHYGLNDIGQLKVGCNADFILLDDINEFEIKQTYINGKLVYDKGNVLFDVKKGKILNNFNANKIDTKDLLIDVTGKYINIIKAFDSLLFTDLIKLEIVNNSFAVDTEKDYLKIVVLNRYQKNIKPIIGYINGFGLKKGALASSIAHDSHNIIAIGTNDEDIVSAINKIIDIKGGIVVADNKSLNFLKLEVAGLITYQEPKIVANKYKELNSLVRQLGSQLNSPFMTMSFMALLVIPKLKIGDKGLFDVTKFNYVNLFED
ncbi:MAG: adenine deaminase [Bacteroidota bacterium]|nr:adenine deaminase [Bacteroidota bacterium]